MIRQTTYLMPYQLFQHPRRPRWRMNLPATCLPQLSALLIPFGGGLRTQPLTLVSLEWLATIFVSQVSFHFAYYAKTHAD